jgi:hypothetical protein
MKSKAQKVQNDTEVRSSLDKLLNLRKQLWTAQKEVSRIAELGRAEQKKFDALLVGKSSK